MHYNPTKKLFIPESVFLFFVIISIPGDYRGMRTLTFNIHIYIMEAKQANCLWPKRTLQSGRPL